MVLLISILVFVSVAIMAYWLEQAIFGQYTVSRRVSGLIGSEVGIRQVELNRPLAQRVIAPLLTGISTRVAKNLPSTWRQRLQRDLQKAGNPANMGPAEFMAVKLVLPLLLASLGAIAFLGDGWNIKVLPIIALALLAGWLLPDLYLRQRTEQRRQKISKSLPDIIDLLSVSMEAGLGFDGSMAQVVEKGSGPLVDEFRRVLQEISMGRSRRESLKDMAARVGMEEVSTFVNAVVQAEQFGVGIASVLRQEAAHMRVLRRQAVEEQAMKAPIKMLFPLIFFIFPFIFVVLLGPAVIQVLTALQAI